MFNEVLTEAHDVSFLVGYIKLDCNLGKIIAANSALTLFGLAGRTCQSNESANDITKHLTVQTPASKSVSLSSIF